MTSSARTAYERHRTRALERNAARTVAGQDIGAIPPIKDPARRARADRDFRFFCETYFPKLFTLAWSDDHLKVIGKIENAVQGDGLFAVAMPRGSGKTTLCQVAAVWSILTGRHPFVFLIAATAEYANDALDNIKSHLSSNELLLEDFPEAIYPIRCLEGESRRCSGQRYYGRLTRIGWNADEIILPTIPWSRCSGAVVRTAGLLGNVRGANHMRADGTSVRPTLVVVDDPQTDASARSPAQVVERLSVINGAILNLAGPGRRISGLMPCTVIRKDDLADQLLDRVRHPEWQGERTRLVYSFPSNEKLWAEYAKLRAESLRNSGTGETATQFYLANFDAMNAGARIAWPARYDTKKEISALQHAMNLRLHDERAFWAEYQNEPMPEVEIEAEMLDAPHIAAKVNGYKRGELPSTASRVTAFIDVQGSLLFWMVAAWGDDFTGSIVDYGAYPDQKRPYFTLRDAKKTLQSIYKGAGLEAALYAGLGATVDLLAAKEFRRDDGTMARVERIVIDANWGQSTDVVYQFCRQSPHSALLTPSHGKYVGASSIPFSEYKKKPGDRIGTHWRIPAAQRERPVRYVLIDTNWWKSFVHARLVVPMGDDGCLSLFSGSDHRMLADQLVAEYPVRTQARDRIVDEWRSKPGNPDNHWLDCLVGSAVAASMCGVTLGGDLAPRVTPKKPPLKLSALKGGRR